MDVDVCGRVWCRDGDMTTWTSDVTSRIEGQALPVTTPRHRHAKSHNFTFETNRVHHHGAHSLLSHINQHDIWKKMPFWEFYIVRVTAFRPQFSSNSADGSNRSVSPSSRHLSSAVTPTRQGMPAFTDTRTSEEVIFQVVRTPLIFYPPIRLVWWCMFLCAVYRSYVLFCPPWPTLGYQNLK
jgi:hypothetical protein